MHTCTHTSTCISGEQFSVNGSNSHQFRATDVLISLCTTDDHEEQLEALLRKYTTQDVKFEVKNKFVVVANVLLSPIQMYK